MCFGDNIVTFIIPEKRSKHARDKVENSICNDCQHLNYVSMNYFVGHDYKFRKSAVAMWQTCGTDVVVSLEETLII